MAESWTVRVVSPEAGAADRLDALAAALAAVPCAGAPPRVRAVGGGPVEFSARYEAPSLHEHDPAWLARLLCEAAVAVGADRGTITTDRLEQALTGAFGGARRRVGALSLAPDGVLADALPASVVAYPCGASYASGRVVAVDLRRCAADPASVVDDLIAVDAALAARAATRV
jgi:hypothetical protein